MKRLLIIALLALFALPLAAQDTMPAYVPVKVGGFGAGDPLAYGLGYPVFAFATNQYVGKQTLPLFVQFVITDATPDEINEAYCVEWKREIDWEFVSHNMGTDTHVLNVFTKVNLVSASGLNALTRDKVESFLNRWGATVQSISSNSVVFSANVATAIASDAFWSPLDVSLATFNELTGYTAANGTHTVQVQWGNIPGATEGAVIGAIVSQGCTVVGKQTAQKRVNFTCHRDTVFSEFKLDIQQKAQAQFSRRKWAFNQAAIDAAIAAGGSLEVTRQQALNFLHNRLLD